MNAPLQLSDIATVMAENVSNVEDADFIGVAESAILRIVPNASDRGTAIYVAFQSILAEDPAVVRIYFWNTAEVHHL